MKRITLAVAAILIILVVLFLFRDHPRLEPLVAPLQKLAPSVASSPASAPSLAPALPPPPGAKPGFVEFMGRESIALDSTNLDTEAAERRALDQAEAMGPLEIQYSRDIVLSEGSANQRVLALYLLTLAGPKAAGALREIVLAPLPDGRVKADSEEEHRLMQEKAQRVTAIDALADQAKKDPAARDSLLRLADEVRDQGLRAYILKKIQSLPR
jgi:hypothetical protein